MVSRRNFIKLAAMTAGAGATGTLGAYFLFYDSDPIKEEPKYRAQFVERDQSKGQKTENDGVGRPYKHSLKRHFGEYSHSGLNWKKLRDGLYFTRIEIYNDGQAADSAALVLAEPDKNAMKVYHNGKSAKPVDGWRARTHADVIFNGSYYRYELDKEGAIASIEPATRIITRGKHKGGLVQGRPTGMLLAEPKNEKAPYMKLVDMAHEKIDISSYNEGIQSWPLLVDANGQIRVKKSKWYANRTAACCDRDENIIVLTTEGGFFSLHELGRFLKASKLGIKKAMNMDGGYEAEMSVLCGGTDYLTFGQWETQGDEDIDDISIPGIKIGLPVVVGIHGKDI